MAIINETHRVDDMAKKTKDYWQEWAEALLCAGAAGDDEAAGLYPVAQALASGQSIASTDLLLLTDYIGWVEKNNRG